MAKEKKEQAKKDEANKPKQEEPMTAASSSLPAMGGLPAIGGGMGLPSIGGRGGNFMIDDAYMKKAKQELNKLNEIADFDSKPASS